MALGATNRQALLAHAGRLTGQIAAIRRYAK